jgi:GNAT superfamily N-acetyltransferase
MRELIPIKKSEEWRDWTAGSSSFNPVWLERHQPDSHWVLVDPSGQLCGHCSVWWRHVPSYPGHRLGLVGHYFAIDQAASDELLSEATRRLAKEGCTLAVGPMDGNSWRRYRLICERGEEPLFFMEPDNPDSWVEYFKIQGFTPLAHYISSLHEDPPTEDPRLEQTARRLEAAGIIIRPFRLDEFTQELRRIFAISSESFQQNFLYSPINEAEFLEQYKAIEPLLQPDLVLLAEQAERPVGFCFCIPDYLEKKFLGRIETVIVKTLAIRKERRLGGLGSLLVQRCEQQAFRRGFRRMIHALMHESNVSANIGCGRARVMRRYALYARPLR